MTGITGRELELELASLDAGGQLICRTGFCWDAASGAIDTPDMLAPSLAHDAICQMAYQDWSVRKEGDVYFRKLLKDYGCPWIRRWYCYVFVRGYSRLMRITKKGDGNNG